MSNVSAGWYPDPSNAPQSRWWDGGQWTERTQPFAAPAAPPEPGKVPRKKRGSGLIFAGLLISVIGVALAIMAAASTHVDAYGVPVSGGPTPAVFLLIAVGLILAVIGFCMRVLGTVEK